MAREENAKGGSGDELRYGERRGEERVDYGEGLRYCEGRRGRDDLDTVWGGWESDRVWMNYDRVKTAKWSKWKAGEIKWKLLR